MSELELVSIFLEWYVKYYVIDNFLVLIKFETSSNGLISLSDLFQCQMGKETGFNGLTNDPVLLLLGNLTVFKGFFCQLQI